jgi:hypothetical protein
VFVDIILDDFLFSICTYTKQEIIKNNVNKHQPKTKENTQTTKEMQTGEQ